MTARERYEYHFIADRILERRIQRPPNALRWHFAMDQATLVAVIERGFDAFCLRRGPAATDMLVVDAVRHHQGLLVDPLASDIGPAVPVALAKEVGKHVEAAVRQAASQFRYFAEETDITGFLKGSLQSPVFRHGEWQAQISAWTYPRRPKERDLGVDIGLVVDVLAQGRRVVKALWFQAKKAERVPQNILELPGLAEQIGAMQVHTREAFALIYTPEDVIAFRGDRIHDALSLESVVHEAMLCRRGDRAPQVVALTADSKLMLEVLVTGPPPGVTGTR